MAIRIAVLLGWSFVATSFAAEKVSFTWPEPTSLTFVKMIAYLESPRVQFSAGFTSDWQSGTCEVRVRHPNRTEGPLRDPENEIRCQGRDRHARPVSVSLSLASSDIDFWGDFRCRHSVTLTGELVFPILKAMRKADRAGLTQTDRRFERLEVSDGDTTLGWYEILTQETKEGADGSLDTGRVAFTCAITAAGDRIQHSDCYVIDPTE